MDSKMARRMLFTSESVTEAHPDKLADQISDAILDECLKQDREANLPIEEYSRVAIETLLTRGLAVVAGELTTHGYVEIPDVVRKTINDVGYTHTDYGFDGDTTGVMVAIQKQSPDIAQGVNTGGAGDQGMMFGYACTETEQLMPLPITIAHHLTRQLAQVRKQNPELGLRPDGKSQVTIEYVDGKPYRIDTVLVSAQHEPHLSQQDVMEIVKEHVLEPVLKHYQPFNKGDFRFLCNPTGRFEIGGPQADTGVTGRKIMVDTYGGMARHGGGAFSGKDPTKVDRSATYMMRYVAKNVVAAGLAERCELQIAYAIGRAEPVSLTIDCFGTNTIPEEQILKRVMDIFDFRPRSIIRDLGLLTENVCYLRTAKNGHFGNPEFPWEKTDKAHLLK